MTTPKKPKAAAKKPVSTNAAKKKPRGKPFTGADDPRRSNAGQRNAKAVRTAAQYREYLVDIMHEKLNTPPNAEATYLEVMAFTQVRNAVNDPDERERVLDRIWGKSTQSLDHTSSDGTMTPPASFTFTPYAKPERKDTDSPETD